MAGGSIASAEPLPPLQGRWLVAARVGWVLGALAMLGIFLSNIPGYYGPQDAPSPSLLAGLHAIGWTATTYITFELVQDCLVMAVFTALGWLIFLRRSDDRVALLVAIFLVIYGANSSSVTQGPVTLSPLATHIIDSVSGVIAFVPAALFFYLFPSGRFVPRWTRWFVLAWVIFAASYNIVDTLIPGLLGGVIALTLWGSFLVAQIYRYVRVSTPIDRVRTKWVLYGAAAAISGNLAQILLSPAVANGYGPLALISSSKDQLGFTLPPPLQGVGGVIAMSVIANLAFLMIPITLAIAILRYQLFDIDVIINRTLVYGSLTAVLGAIYFGSIVILQALLHGITGTTSGIALVVSTLLIAVLFQPLRRRLQGTIDRRFYREKYNAARVVDQFSASLAQKVELDDVTSSLLDTVERTMHPAQVSLWIRTPEQAPSNSQLLSRP